MVTPWLRPWRRRCIYPSLAYRQNLLSSLKTSELHSILQSTLSRHQSSRSWWCWSVKWQPGQRHIWSEYCCRETFPMVLVDTAGATCAQISSLDAVRAATAARTKRRFWRASVYQNLVYECGPLLKAAIHDRYFVPNICSFPQAYNMTSFKWPNCAYKWKMLGTIYRRMSSGTFMNVFMREYTPSFTPEAATLCIDVTVWAPLTVKYMFHLVWIYHIVL